MVYWDVGGTKLRYSAGESGTHSVEPSRLLSRLLVTVEKEEWLREGGTRGETFYQCAYVRACVVRAPHGYET